MRESSFKVIDNVHGLHFMGTLFYKFNVLCGYSASGKSTLGYALEQYPNKSINMFTLNNLYDHVYESESFKNRIIFIDDIGSLKEDSVNVSTLMQKAKCTFLIVERDWLPSVSIDYRAYYKWRQSGKYYELVQYFNSYDKFNPKAANYVTEDSGSGLQYFSKVLPNVVSSNGNSNIKEFCKDSYVIADASAIGPYLNTILELKPVGIFLPTSFESLVSEALKPNMDEVIKPFEYCSDEEYNSLEWYYTRILCEICNEYFKVKYDKSRCPKFLYDNKSLLRKLGLNISTNDIWNMYKSKYHVIDDKLEIKRLKRISGATNKEELLDFIDNNFL